MSVNLRVASYNVHGLHGDVDALVALVKPLGADVVIVQEAPRRFRWRTPCAELARRLGLFVAEGGQPALGNLLLTNQRVAVHDTWCVQFPLTPGRHMRGAALARCSVARTPFVVAGSHLSTDPVERPAQAAILAKVLSEVDDPLIFGGDLNDADDSVAWRTIADGRQDAAVVLGRSGTATYPVVAPRARLDVIFADPRVEVRDYRVVTGPEAARASDHLPIVADLTLRTDDLRAAGRRPGDLGTA